jgi:NAD(P)-dependent dehydrogenase (short-subunit alcohol dehydrogenase family)
MSFLQFYRDQDTDLPIATTKAKCRGKTFIVTGANTGLGFEAARHLVRCKPNRVILAVRSLERSESAKKRIEEETRALDIIEVWELELSSFDSIRAFAQRGRSTRQA